MVDCSWKDKPFYQRLFRVPCNRYWLPGPSQLWHIHHLCDPLLSTRHAAPRRATPRHTTPRHTWIHLSELSRRKGAIATHLMPLDRRGLAITLPLVAQHIVVLFKYWNGPLYAVCIHVCIDTENSLYEYKCICTCLHIACVCVRETSCAVTACCTCVRQVLLHTCMHVCVSANGAWP